MREVDKIVEIYLRQTEIFSSIQALVENTTQVLQILEQIITEALVFQMKSVMINLTVAKYPPLLCTVQYTQCAKNGQFHDESPAPT